LEIRKNKLGEGGANFIARPGRKVA